MTIQWNTIIGRFDKTSIYLPDELLDLLVAVEILKTSIGNDFNDIE